MQRLCGFGQGVNLGARLSHHLAALWPQSMSYHLRICEVQTVTPTGVGRCSYRKQVVVRYNKIICEQCLLQSLLHSHTV